VDGKDAKADLQMDGTEEAEAKIKMECRGVEAITLKGSTTSSEGGVRRKCKEMEERAVDQLHMPRSFDKSLHTCVTL
jgi:hypothetical protein